MSHPTYSALLASLLPPAKPIPLLPSPSGPYSTGTTSQIASLSLHPTLEALLHILNDDLPSAHFLVRHMQSPDPPKQPGPAGQQSSYAAASIASSIAPTPAPSPAQTDTAAEPRNTYPRAEGMLIHALLHRIELDTDNALAWYADVSAIAASGMWRHVWPGGLPDVASFLERVQRIRGAAPHLRAFEKKFGAAQPSGDVDVEAEMSELQGISEREIRALAEWCEGRYGTGTCADARLEWRSHGDKIGKLAENMVVGGEGWRQF